MAYNHATAKFILWSDGLSEAVTKKGYKVFTIPTCKVQVLGGITPHTFLPATNCTVTIQDGTFTIRYRTGYVNNGVVLYPDSCHVTADKCRLSSSTMSVTLVLL